MESQVTRYMKNRVAHYLEKTGNGRSFDGIIQDATIGIRASGNVYGASPLHKDGDFITTDLIKKTGNILSCGYYVETENNRRYLISDVTYNESLPKSTFNVQSAMNHINEYLRQ